MLAPSGRASAARIAARPQVIVRLEENVDRIASRTRQSLLSFAVYLFKVAFMVRKTPPIAFGLRKCGFAIMGLYGLPDCPRVKAS
jgi:hypothetical protein